MNRRFYLDVSCRQNPCHGERVCGDVYLAHNFVAEDRNIIVLSDGLGHGVKANMLGILTTTMALNFTHEHKETNRIAETILRTLPVDSEKQISFATFSIVDIETDGQVNIIEYENPQCLVLRGTEVFSPEWTCLLLDIDRKIGKELKTCSFQAQLNDRIVLFTDGVIQAGMGSRSAPMGWGLEQVHQFVADQVRKNPSIDSSELAYKVVSEAIKKDGFEAKDDTSCVVIYFRHPRQLLICTGPPSSVEKDADMAQKVKNFPGRKIICGGITGTIIARELNLTIDENAIVSDPELPPMNKMEGVDLLTEGIITLNKVHKILENYNSNYPLTQGPADQIVQLLLESDDIHFLVGTAINTAHQDVSLPVELEIRRTVVRRIMRTLEEKFLKHVSVEFM
ncbi:MAG TPA: SpoIIE family protein phosphatase [Bacteroidales bacterium]|nr:SpoIIE family protein phosphatase [Bacteroidales bacterium]HPO64356.1 SpoIIE family protein phosphatase [Bacteroidales bacterium]